MSKDAYFNVCRDPWDAPPAGIPDMFESHTVPLKIKASYLITSQADGTFVLAFQPLVSNAFTASGTGTAGNITAFALAGHPDIASLTSQFSVWRPVSIGAKIFYLGAEGTSSGVITCGHNDYMNLSTANIGTTAPTAIADWNDLPNASAQAVATMTEPMAVAGRSFDRSGFKILTGGTAFLESFPTVWVTGTNLPTGIPVCRIEVSFNIEAIPYYGNTLTAHLQSVTTPNESVIMDTHRRLGVVRAGNLSKVMTAKSAPRKKGKAKRKRKTKRKYKSARATILMQPTMGNRAPTKTYQSSSRKRAREGYVRY